MLTLICSYLEDENLQISYIYELVNFTYPSRFFIYSIMEKSPLRIRMGTHLREVANKDGGGRWECLHRRISVHFPYFVLGFLGKWDHLGISWTLGAYWKISQFHGTLGHRSQKKKVKVKERSATLQVSQKKKLKKDYAVFLVN